MRLRHPRNPERPSLHAAIYPRLLDRSVITPGNEPRARLKQIAQWVEPLYWLRFKPVGIKDAAEFEVSAYSQRADQATRKVAIKLGQLRNPSGAHPTTVAVALSLLSPRIEHLPVNDSLESIRNRHLQYGTLPLEGARSELARERRIDDHDVIIVADFVDRGSRMLTLCLPGFRTFSLWEGRIRSRLHATHWYSRLSEWRSIEPGQPVSKDFGTLGVVDVWWDHGPQTNAPPRRTDW